MRTIDLNIIKKMTYINDKDMVKVNNMEFPTFKYMKRTILSILGLIFGVLWSFPQSGIWSGDLDVQGIKLPLVFNLDNDNPIQTWQLLRGGSKQR